jgi:hypothetical protein
MGERGQFGVAFQHAPPRVMSEGAIEPNAGGDRQAELAGAAATAAG